MTGPINYLEGVSREYEVPLRELLARGVPVDCPKRLFFSRREGLLRARCIGQMSSARICVTCGLKARSMIDSGYVGAVLNWIDRDWTEIGRKEVANIPPAVIFPYGDSVAGTNR